MKYFDFHVHTILKQLFSDNPNIDTLITGGEVNTIVNLCTDVPNIIASQVHQSQLAEFSDEVIAGVTLYGLESNLADGVIPLSNLLKAGSRHKMSEQLLTDVRDNNVKAFTDFVLSRTLDNFINAPTSFNILTKESFDSPLPLNKVNVFFVIEGCHSLVDTFNRFKEPDEFFPPDEIIQNLDILLDKVNIICINPTHLQQSNLCNHAFAIQLTSPDPFIPSGNGLTDDGRKVIQGMFDRGICVDVKHMSYKSRLDLRDEIDSGSFTNTQPLLCTHAGFTGVPFTEWPGYISSKRTISGAIYLEVAKTMQTNNQPTRPGAPAFNMTTINLFDEEILWIVLNGGMIGLSMDRRIIGYVDKFDDKPTGLDQTSSLVVDKEFISKTEWQELGIKNSQLRQFSEGDCVTLDDLDESAEGPIPLRNEYFFDHVLLHLKHYFQIFHDRSLPFSMAKKQITIGSDFDGFINPFINMPTVKEMRELKEYIRMNFKFYLESLSDSAQWANQLDVNEFVEDLFYNNGFNFIKSRF